MNIKKLTLMSGDYPERLKHIPDPPARLYHTGAPLDELLKRPVAAIVGTRKISPYGQMVTRDFARYLAERGVVIVSGLALGLDALAHATALECGALTIAVLPGPLDRVVPATNRRLAERILDSGGALVSEYPAGEPPRLHYFIARNRIVSGLSDVVLIPEAGGKSGAMHTANFAVDQGREILVVPGNIYAPGSEGVNNLLRQSQAGAATRPADVLSALGLENEKRGSRQVKGADPDEQVLLDLLQSGLSDGHELFEKSGLGVSLFNRTLTMLEIKGLIRPLGANHWSIC